jgi:hypothetical protein
VRVVRGDVGRVRDDHVEAAAGERRVPRSLDEFDALPAAQRGGVRARDIERGLAGIRCDDACIRALAGEGQGDRAGAGSEVKDAGGGAEGRRGGRRDKAVSTKTSVSGRGISTSGVTVNMRP